MKTRLTMLIALIGIAVILAGCGGGGGGTTSVPTPSTVQAINTEIQKAGANWQAAENPISQLPTDDRKKLSGLILESHTSPRIGLRNALEDAQLPTSLDWRSKDGFNWITSVKNQGMCGSCVSFASLGVTEALTRIANNNSSMSIDLSESDLFSCGGARCSQGWYLSSAADRLKNTGVVDEACLPYQAQDNVCQNKCSNWQSRLTTINSWVYAPTDRTSIKNYLLQGPVMAAMAVYTDFFYYHSGVYQHVTGGLEGYHAVAIVGYNDSGQYWIVKNSWGASWGENGFFRIKYGDSQIEHDVLVMQMVSNQAGVTASVSATNVTLSGGQAQVTLTCSTNGTVSSLEGKCANTDSWSTITSGNTKICTYTSAGAYTPSCRVNGTTTDDVDTPVTVASIGVTASVSPSSGNTSTVFTVTCSVSGGTASTIEGRCNTSDSWATISSGNTKSCSYTSAGSYTPGCRINSTISDNADSPITVSTPANQSPVASVSATPTSGLTPLTVQFTGGCTDSDGSCVSYSWNFGDGSPTSTSQNPSHIYSSTGTFTAILTVTDDDGATGQNSTIISASNSQSQAQKVSAGDHTCVLTTGGGMKCWGWNRYGAVGDGSTTNRTSPVDVSGLTSGVTAIAAGSEHTCALTTSGGVKCWGYNAHSEVGDGTTTNRYTPVNVSGLTSGVTAIAAGGWHTCALTSGGGVKCWGINGHGELGNGTTTVTSVPVNVSGLTSGVTAIAAGMDYTCALTTGGGVKCWGWGQFGNLGDGSSTYSYTPVNVSGLTSGVTAVTAGQQHMCALTSGGGVKCWGYNISGSLGDGTTTDRNTPVNVIGLTSGVIAISAGWDHTCAITTGGGLKCWGANNNGQLGDGTTTNRSTPTDVSGLTSGVAVVSSGGKAIEGFTCVITSSGGIKCWGENQYGNLGDGTTTDRYTSVNVLGF